MSGLTSVITDLAIDFGSSTNLPFSNVPNAPKWSRIEKDLYLHSTRRSAWLYVAQVEATDLTTNDLVIKAIKIGKQNPSDSSEGSWESRPGGIWIQKSSYTGDIKEVVTGVDVLFGPDAVDPRQHWTLLQPPIHLETQPKTPIPRLSVRHGKAKPTKNLPTKLRVKEGGKFKIIQISDTHMVTGVGVCKDAIDSHGKLLPESEADPLTVRFMGEILDVEKPDLVILTGDQLHHDILDSQSALFKVVAPLIERSIPYAAVFGNHDDEGTYALSLAGPWHQLPTGILYHLALGAGAAQMSILQELPFSLCQPGPGNVDGVGNFYLQIFAYEPSERPLSTLYLLDSHGSSSNPLSPGYQWITQSQIDWFTATSRRLRREREKDGNHSRFHLSLAFQHIPVPEYGDEDLIIKGGQRGEPSEGPEMNSHFYDALVKEGVSVLSCGHDHVNDFCGILPKQKNDGSRFGPWLCYAGGSGFGGYGQYGEKRYHRRMRVWDIDINTGSIKTWKRVEYAKERVDELILVKASVAVVPHRQVDVD